MRQEFTPKESQYNHIARSLRILTTMLEDLSARTSTMRYSQLNSDHQMTESFDALEYKLGTLQDGVRHFYIQLADLKDDNLDPLAEKVELIHSLLLARKDDYFAPEDNSLDLIVWVVRVNLGLEKLSSQLGQDVIPFIKSLDDRVKQIECSISSSHDTISSQLSNLTTAVETMEGVVISCHELDCKKMSDFITSHPMGFAELYSRLDRLEEKIEKQNEHLAFQSLDTVLSRLDKLDQKLDIHGKTAVPRNDQAPSKFPRLPIFVSPRGQDPFLCNILKLLGIITVSRFCD